MKIVNVQLTKPQTDLIEKGHKVRVYRSQNVYFISKTEDKGYIASNWGGVPFAYVNVSTKFT